MSQFEDLTGYGLVSIIYEQHANIQIKDEIMIEVARHGERGLRWWWRARRGGVCPPRVW